MPELPEVETVRRSLAGKIIGAEIRGVRIFKPDLIKYPSLEEFEKQIRGEVFEQVDRRGKYLMLQFASGNILLVHLRMTGQLLYVDPEAEGYKHTRAIFELSTGKELRFVDIRGFGTMHYFNPEELACFPGLTKLGPDPTGEGFTLDWWLEKLKTKKTRIKPLLLDQTFISGLGNIYADESLYRAKINPACPAYQLSEVQAVDLYWAIKDVLAEGIKHRGTTISDYLDAEGQKGGFQNFLQAYGQKGTACSCCGEKIVRIKLGGRSTYFCPNCQGEQNREEF
jgi:formamidopyrimidine-DNA glycosylase